jgi:phosphatidylserine/phosphatidylglycerophosphate/cardiolipin synthase-like enzyme
MVDTDIDWLKGDTATGMSAVKRFSQVSFFIDAEEFYADLRHEVTNAGAARKGLVCWIGFEVSGSTPMPATPARPVLKPFARREPLPDDTAWIDVLASATNQETYVRALLNLHPSPKDPTGYLDHNFSTVEKLNQLKNTLAINDFRYLFMNGTHHQKLIIVCNDLRPIAYVGTMDVHWQRIKDRWCEVCCKVQGEAARELYRVFFERWIEHTAMLAGLPAERSWIPKPDELLVNSGGGNLVTQVSVTFGNPGRQSPFSVFGPRQQVVNSPHRLTLPHSRVPVLIGSLFLSPSPPLMVGNDFFTEKDSAAPPLIEAAKRQEPTYRRFAPSGRTGIYHQIEAALARCRKFIYLEDQYLVDDMPMGSLKPMLGLLEDRVKDKDFQKLIVLCPRLDSINEDMQGLAGPHRRKFVEGLVSAGGDKVVICQYKSNAALKNGLKPDNGSPFYVHSKTWVFDDELLIVGSANCNRRGYSHDSELDLAVYDLDKTAIRDLRAKIWLRRLNTEGITKPPLAEADVREFLSAAKYWEKPAEYGLIIENNRMMSPGAFVPASTPGELIYDTGGFDPVITELALTAVAAIEAWLWDTVVDPGGT